MPSYSAGKEDETNIITALNKILTNDEGTAGRGLPSYGEVYLFGTSIIGTDSVTNSKASSNSSESGGSHQKNSKHTLAEGIRFNGDGGDKNTGSFNMVSWESELDSISVNKSEGYTDIWSITDLPLPDSKRYVYVLFLQITIYRYMYNDEMEIIER